MRAMIFLLGAPLYWVVTLSAGASTDDGAVFNHAAIANIRYSYGHFDIDSQTAKSSFREVHNNVSKLTYNGSYGNDRFSAIYSYVSGVDPFSSGPDTIRYASTIGLQSKVVGSIKYGRMSTPYKISGLEIDPFFDTSAGLTAGGSNFGLSRLTMGFTDRSLVYTTPSFGGVSATWAVALKRDAKEDADQNLGLAYKGERFGIGVQHLQVESDPAVANSIAKDKAARLHGSYRDENWSLGMSLELFDRNSHRDDPRYFYIAGTARMNRDLYVAVSYGAVANDASRLTDRSVVAYDGEGTTLAAFWTVYENTQLYFLSSLVEFEDSSRQANAVLGFRYQFRWVARH